MQDEFEGEIESSDAPIQRIEFKVPTFPQRKHPGSTLSVGSSVGGAGSTQDSINTSKLSGRDSLSNTSHVFEGPYSATSQDKQILSMIQAYGSATGITKRELECKIIRNLTNQKKQFDHQEQYIISMPWVRQYTSYLYDNNTVRPARIDNTHLFEDTHKRVLKRNLLANQDFVVVNDVVWLFLKQEYSGGPEMLFDAYQQLTQQQTQQPKPKVPVPLQVPEDRSKNRPKSMEPSTNQQGQAPQASHQKINFEIPLLGFKNELFFCYMNSGLQSLLSLPDFNYFFMKILKHQYRETVPRKTIQTYLPNALAYLELIEQVRYNESKEYIKVGTLRESFSKKFSPRQQHDCQEFVLHLLSTIEDELNMFFKELRKQQTPIKFEVNMVHYLFKGMPLHCTIGLIESRVQCGNKQCQHTTQVQEPFITLSLALKAKTLEECLDEFFKDERVKDYKCEKCRHNNTTKSTYLCTQPKHIILHVKRFKFFPKQHKISQMLQYPLDGLSLKKYLLKPQVPEIQYKLRAVVVHSGSLDNGHYFCFGRRFHSWFLFNDQSVQRVNKKDLLSQQAYLLFYSQNHE